MKKENARVTERAVYASLLGILVSCLLLLESTYAWFTQEISTPVSVIQTGCLNVNVVVADNQGFINAVEMDDQNITHNNLIFRQYNVETQEGSGDTAFLPGMTYCLPEIYIQNNGNIDVNYSITLAHVEGPQAVYANSEEEAYTVNEQEELVPISLYDVLEFSAYVVKKPEVNPMGTFDEDEEHNWLGDPIPLVVEREGMVLAVAAEDGEEQAPEETNQNPLSGVLEANATSEAIVIQVKMKDEADIQYAGLELSGLEIVVNASQMVPVTETAEETNP